MMLWGYFMKLCVAERVAPYVNAVFNNWERHNGTSLLLATFFFAFQIYCDFCGYSLIARGVAAVLGFRLMDNFKRPYLASSLKEFWRRWHISLSTWFMDYVYIPLGGNRCSALRHAYNLFVTFLLSGIWHGANWTFVIWGAIHGTFLAAAALLRRGTCAAAKTGPGGASRLIGWPVTFAVVLFAWIFFRANNVTAAFGIIGKIFTQPGPLFPGDGVPNQALGIFCIGILMMRELKEEFFPRFRLLTSDRFIVSAFSAAVLAVFILLTAVWHGGEFIYFQF
jgi:D-alanyl-lipoteichoic acid acyltransferase DltB (MBOAT superfamily)